jgi:DNA topoisomerase I
MKSPADTDEKAGARPSVEAASLTYVSDAEPGIRRRRAGKGFWYSGPEGDKIGDAETLDRIARLAIPPAWKDVWISPYPDGHLQATGRDERGRKQYRYHERWTLCRDEVKYSSLVEFARALPRLRQRIDADLRRHGLPRERVLASVVWLLDNSMIRVGNAAYAKENKSFGLTTLRDRHVQVDGSTLRFAFKGKSGKDWNLRISDRRIARVVKGAQDLPGQHLFQYLDESGAKNAVRSQDVNAYIREASEAGFSSKHFRTWGGTVRAVHIFAQTEPGESKRELARTMNMVIDQVAARLGNTRTVCRNCYIHPLVFDAWREGRLGREIAAVKGRLRKQPDGLDEDEALVLRWLEQSASE